ncbi:hypothetical protein GCM10017577_64330 [Pseudonocardia halophobica]|uniref:5,10-methylene-tetrahydrofolate dehydrogenase n=1 Tax=Pseudonocardia halophobica TaxID=29401 RepID=A0A9W6NZZ1_9PSEU|nr:hypothetical protein [Pseudonocardia halophobica]GLL15283.1 hypothetical protein GCM10017577_64330 [Pseudonocardia halophobica]
MPDELIPEPVGHAAADGETETDTETVTVVGLLADPNLPGELATRLAEGLPQVLAARLDAPRTWEVETVVEPFEANDRGERALDRARERVRRTRWDVAVCLTDVPARSSGVPVVAQVGERDRVAVVSVPALGGVRLLPRVRDAVVELVGRLLGIDAAAAARRPTRRAALLTDPDALGDDADDSDETVLTRRGSLRLLAGMVRTNRPWRLAVGLGTALAGAAAGSAFGLLYSNLWTLAAALEPWRLGLAFVGSIAVFVAWLIVGHRLWERGDPELGLDRLLNLGTVLTLATGTGLFSLALLVLNSIVAAVIIPASYLSQVLGHPAGLADYVPIVVLATIMGVVAGAVGSGLEDDATVRLVAYGHRQRERRDIAARLEAGAREE